MEDVWDYSNQGRGCGALIFLDALMIGKWEVWLSCLYGWRANSEEEDQVLQAKTKNEKFIVISLYYALESRTFVLFSLEEHLEDEGAT